MRNKNSLVFSPCGISPEYRRGIMLLVWLDMRATRKSWQLDDDSIVDRTQRDFRIVIYLAGGVPSLQQDLCSYANRYFIPVYENKDRGWRVRWFSRGKFNEGHSGSCRRTGYKPYRGYERFSLSFADRDRHLRTVLLPIHFPFFDYSSFPSMIRRDVRMNDLRRYRFESQIIARTWRCQ